MNEYFIENTLVTSIVFWNMEQGQLAIKVDL